MCRCCIWLRVERLFAEFAAVENKEGVGFSSSEQRGPTRGAPWEESCPVVDYLVI